jgi:hypothetical protein
MDRPVENYRGLFSLFACGYADSHQRPALLRVPSRHYLRTGWVKPLQVPEEAPMMPVTVVGLKPATILQQLSCSKTSIRVQDKHRTEYI